MGPFVVNVAEELRQPGHQAPLVLAGPIPGIALSSARVRPDADVQFAGTVEAHGATVIVQGTVHAPWVGECRRCLEAIDSDDVQVELREVFEPHPVEGETFPLDDELIDLEPMLREAVALGLPVAPLCGEDCAGPDPEAHPVGDTHQRDEQDQQDDDHDPEPRERDPRWAVLDQLRLD